MVILCMCSEYSDISMCGENPCPENINKAAHITALLIVLSLYLPYTAGATS